MASIILDNLKKLSIDLPSLDKQVRNEIEESINNERVKQLQEEIKVLRQSIMDKVNQ